MLYNYCPGDQTANTSQQACASSYVTNPTAHTAYSILGTDASDSHNRSPGCAHGQLPDGHYLLSDTTCQTIEQYGATPPAKSSPKKYWCPYCLEKSRFVQAKDMWVHVDRNHEKSDYWKCRHANCKLYFCHRRDYEAHHKDQHELCKKSCYTRRRAIKIVAVACGMKDCPEVFLSTASQGKGNATHDSRRHITQHMTDGASPADWSYSTRTRNLLRQPSVREAWEAVVKSHGFSEFNLADFVWAQSNPDLITFRLERSVFVDLHGFLAQVYEAATRILPASHTPMQTLNLTQGPQHNSYQTYPVADEEFSIRGNEQVSHSSPFSGTVSFLICFRPCKSNSSVSSVVSPSHVHQDSLHDPPQSTMPVSSNATFAWNTTTTCSGLAHPDAVQNYRQLSQSRPHPAPSLPYHQPPPWLFAQDGPSGRLSQVLDAGVGNLTSSNDSHTAQPQRPPIYQDAGINFYDHSFAIPDNWPEGYSS